MVAVRGTPSGVPGASVRSANPRTATTPIRLAARGGGFLSDEINVMPQFRPLQGNFSAENTLYIDTEARTCDLLETATHRIKAARNLLNSVVCLCVKDAEGHDLEHFSNAAHILIQDGCDALDALGWNLTREGATAATSSSNTSPHVAGQSL